MSKAYKPFGSCLSVLIYINYTIFNLLIFKRIQNTPFDLYCFIAYYVILRFMHKNVTC